MATVISVKHFLLAIYLSPLCFVLCTNSKNTILYRKCSDSPISKKKPAIPEGIAGFFGRTCQDPNECEREERKIDNPGLMHVISIPFSNLNLDCSMFQFINQRAGLTDRQILWLIQIEPFPNKLQWIQTLVSGNGENGGNEHLKLTHPEAK